MASRQGCERQVALRHRHQGGAGGASQYYYASIMFGLCEGPVSDVVAIWPYGKAKQINSWAQSFDTTAVIPVTLDVEQQVRFQVHTFLKRISGTTVKMDNDKKRH